MSITLMALRDFFTAVLPAAIFKREIALYVCVYFSDETIAKFN